MIQPSTSSKNGTLLAIACLLTSSICFANAEKQEFDTFSESSKAKIEAYMRDGSTMSPTDQPTLIAQVQPLDRVQAEQERLKQLLEGKPKAYEDKFMDADTLTTLRLNDGDAAPTAENSGFRSYMAETRMGYANRDGTGIDSQRGSELGLRTAYRFETLNYGEFDFQADVRSRQGENDASLSAFGTTDKKTNGRFTLRNYGFPITANTFVDTSVGDISSETTDALSRNYKFSLGNSTVRGVSSHMFNREFDFRAGIGELGTLVGGPYPGFEKTQGNMAWLGYSQRFSDKVYAGVQLKKLQQVPIQTNGLTTNPADAAASNNLENATSLAASVGYGYALNNDGDKKARLTLLSSRTTAQIEGQNKAANGLYLEGGFKSGRFRNEFGAYVTDPNLRLGEYATGSDTRGAYWRVDHSSSRLNWGLGLDYELQNTKQLFNQPQSKRTAVNANIQQWLDRDSAIGANTYASYFSYDNDSTTSNNYAGYGNKSYVASVNYQTRVADWGRSRVTATVRRNQTLVTNGVAATGQDIAWEHDWVTGKYENMRPEFTTTLGYARDISDGETQTYPTAGVTLRYWPDAEWNIGGNLNYTSHTGNLATSRGVYGSLNTERRIGNAWRLGATLSLNQATVNTTVAALNSPNLSRTNDKSLYVYLRYEGSNGTPLQALGLSNAGSAGGGSISGIVYFDANRDNAQQADERGVPNVEVLLDNRYRVTTDKNGRFEFPLVATGEHQLSMRLESVPLPWGANQDLVTLVNVPLRGTVNTKLPVVRVGE